MSLPPLSTDLPEPALRVLAQATRHDTPCGDGSIVWHSWGNDAGGGEPLRYESAPAMGGIGRLRDALRSIFP